MKKKSTKKSAKRVDPYKKVADSIRKSLDAIDTQWQLPWHATDTVLSLPSNVASTKKYSGVNIATLWMAGLARNFPSGLWGTYRQWTEKGAQVRKGEKGEPVLFYRVYEKENEKGEIKKLWTVKHSVVFNRAQVEGYTPENPPEMEPPARTESIDNWVTSTNAAIHHNSEWACYNRTTDTVEMPPAELFRATEHRTREESYYGTLFHELVHWTAAKGRLDRPRDLLDIAARAKEELIAELGAAFLSAHFGFRPEGRTDHTSYIASWLQLLEEEPKAFVQAASQASKAADYLLHFT